MCSNSDKKLVLGILGILGYHKYIFRDTYHFRPSYSFFNNITYLLLHYFKIYTHRGSCIGLFYKLYPVPKIPKIPKII